MGPSETTEDKATLVDAALKNTSSLYENYFRRGPLSLPPSSPPVIRNMTEDAFDSTVINLLERIKSAPNDKLEPLTMALNAVVQAQDTYTYEEED